MNFENTLDFAKVRCSRCIASFSGSILHSATQWKRRIYFTGNSLGLQPKTTKEYVNQELKTGRTWRGRHFNAKNPWVSYHEIFPTLSKIVGALPEEVVVMNHLTVNLHFY